VAKADDTPIVTGERVSTIYGFLLLDMRVISIIQPDVNQAGHGFECRRIAAVVEAGYISGRKFNESSQASSAKSRCRKTH